MIRIRESGAPAFARGPAPPGSGFVLPGDRRPAAGLFFTLRCAAHAAFAAATAAELAIANQNPTAATRQSRTARATARVAAFLARLLHRAAYTFVPPSPRPQLETASTNASFGLRPYPVLIGGNWPASLVALTTSTAVITWLAVSVASSTLWAGRKPPFAIFMTRASGSVVEGPGLLLLRANASPRSSSTRPTPSPPRGAFPGRPCAGRLADDACRRPDPPAIPDARSRLARERTASDSPPASPAAGTRPPWHWPAPGIPSTATPAGHQALDACVSPRSASTTHPERHGPCQMRQRVVVHRHPAAKPPIGKMLRAQPHQLAGRTHAVQGRVQPQGQQNPRVNRVRPARPSTARIGWYNAPRSSPCTYSQTTRARWSSGSRLSREATCITTCCRSARRNRGRPGGSGSGGPDGGTTNKVGCFSCAGERAELALAYP